MEQIDPDTALKMIGGIVAMLVAIIALTPTKRDDEALRGFLGQLSPLARKTIGGGAVATAIALALSLLGGCGGRQTVAIDTARAAACIKAESRCIDRAEAGDITITQAEACVSCVRSTCDVLREEMVK